MLAYKFLDEQGRAPFTLAPWRIGSWVEAAAAVPCREGVHACRPEHLSYWLGAALWEVELEDPVVETRHKLTARRGRLARPIDGYPAAAGELAATCAWRARDRAVDVLRAGGADQAAARFDAAGSLEELEQLGGQVDDSTFEGAAAALAADAAHFALRGAIAEAPFIAACSAGHIRAGGDGDQATFDAGYAAEREHQSRWLADRLGLAR